MRFWRNATWRLLRIQDEQIQALHDKVRELQAVNEALERVNIDLKERLLEAGEQLLEHSFGCLTERGNLK